MPATLERVNACLAGLSPPLDEHRLRVDLPRLEDVGPVRPGNINEVLIRSGLALGQFRVLVLLQHVGPGGAVDLPMFRGLEDRLRVLDPHLAPAGRSGRPDAVLQSGNCGLRQRQT